MEPILEYHIEETGKRFNDIKEDLRDIKTRLDELREFKIETIATSRLVSLLVSAVCGLITLTISTIVAIKFH